VNVTDGAPRILVVDDDAAVRRFAEAAFRDSAYEAMVVADGDTALAFVARQQRPFDLFVLDLMMPSMRGDELAASLRRTDPDVKVLYLTGFADQLFREKGILWEHEAFLEKPVGVTALMEAVSLLLYGHTNGPEHAAR
jgi:two-component system cell cycle sensor histidine kinase/response regulator CckA